MTWPATNTTTESINAMKVQALYAAGAFHPSIASDLRDALGQRFTPSEYPPPVLRAMGFRCGCLDFYTDPCRMEFRRVRTLPGLRLDVDTGPLRLHDMLFRLLRQESITAFLLHCRSRETQQFILCQMLDSWMIR